MTIVNLFPLGHKPAAYLCAQSLGVPSLLCILELSRSIRIDMVVKITTIFI